jgi:hypothetical protein
MTALVVFIVVAALTGIALLSAKSPLRQVTREQFLQQLAKFLEGQLNPHSQEGYENCFKITFAYDGEDCVFEDLEQKGFKDKVYAGYLKIKTPNKLTLTFTEKKHSLKIRSDIFLASEISTQAVEKRVRLQVPEYLKDLNVTANDPAMANELFEDKKVAGVLKKMKNVNDRGYAFLSLGIIDGIVTLEFHEQNNFKPNLASLRADMASIEDYLGDMVIIVRKLNQLLKQ